MLAQELILYEDLLQERLKTAPVFDPEKHFFSVPGFITFAVRSKMAPQVVESPFYEDMLQIAARDFPSKHILQPRGTAKTGRIAALVTYLIAYPKEQIWGPAVRVACAGETKNMSKRILRKVRSTLETNKYVLATAGNIVPDERFMQALGLKSEPVWTADMFQTTHFIRAMKEEGYTPEEPSCIALSMNQASTGMRYNVLLLDDPVGTETGRSQMKRIKTREVFQELNRQKATNSLMLVLGTRHHEEDIHWSIQTEFGEDFLFNAIDIWGGAQDHEKIWREDFKKNLDSKWALVKPLDEVSLFWAGFGQLEEDVAAGGFPADKDERKRRALHHLRVKMGEMSPGDWAKNYLNACIASHDRIFTEEMFREYPNETFNPARVLNYLLTDAAEGRDFRSSWRVVAVVSVDHEDIAYVRDIDFGVWNPSEFGKRVIEQYYRYGCRSLLVERMAWTQTVKAVLSLTCSNMGKPMPHFEEVPGRTVVSKRSRIESLEPRLAARRMLFSAHLRHKMGPNGRTVWQELVHEFMSVQDIETMPRLKVDIADALSDIDSTDIKDFRICRPPRIYSKSGELRGIVTPPKKPERKIAGSTDWRGRRSILGK